MLIYRLTDYAKLNWLTEEAVRVAITKWQLSKVEFSWEKDWKIFKGKFILPKPFVIVNKEEIMEALKKHS